MTSKATTNTVTYSTDSYRTAIQKIYSELDLLWAQINTVHKAQASTGTEPTDNSTGDLWLNMDPALIAPRLEYWDGSEFQSITGGDQFSSGLTLDNFARGYTMNAIVFPSTNSVYVEGTRAAGEPTTIGVGTAALQNTTRTSLTFSGAAAGNYDIYVDRASEGSSTFVLKKEKVTTLGTRTDATDERTIGYAVWNGSAFTYCESRESRISYPFRVEGTTAPASYLAVVPTGTWTLLTGFTRSFDPWDRFTGGLYTVHDNGYGTYYFSFSMNTNQAGYSGNNLSLYLAVDGTPFTSVMKTDLEAGTLSVSGTVHLGSGDQVGVYVAHSAGVTLNLEHNGASFTGFKVG